MGFGVPWGTPFYTGGGTSTLVPERRHMALAGRAYMLDFTSDAPGWWSEDIPVQRAQADTEADPGEGTLNTEGLWRRTLQSWHRGAGQEFADRPDSVAYRFRSSTGIDPWTKYRLGLLNDTERQVTSANTGLYLAVAADRLYMTDGQVVRYTDDGTTWTAITGNPAATARSIASDGSTVYVAYGASGLYSIEAGAGAMGVHSTGTANAVGYAKGRLLVLEGATSTPRIYNVTASGGAITAGNLLLSVPNLVVEPGQWTAESESAIYIAGFVGDKSRIWRTAVKQDGLELDVPVVATPLPDGQLARSICAYQNGVAVVGTDDRVFVCAIDGGSGNLGVVGNFETEEPCYAFEPQDRFIWYGGAADATLGRMDVSENASGESGVFLPARANDLAAAQAGDVRSVATYLGKRYFTVSGQGVYAETDDKVASGVIDLGVIGFGIGDLKNALYADVRHHPLASGDSVAVEVAKDEGAYVSRGASLEAGAVSKTLGLGQLLAETISLRLTLSGDPVVTMVTARAAPAPRQGVMYRARIRMFRKQADLQNQQFEMDVPTEKAYIEALRAARTAVTFQLGTETMTVVVDRLVRFTPHSEAVDDTGVWTGWFNGTLDVDLKRLEQ